MENQETTRTHRPNNVILLKCTEDSIFRMWIEFLTPFHNLAKKEREVAARILLQYFKLKEQCSDEAVLKELLLSTASRQDMRASLGDNGKEMSTAHFQMVLKALKEANFLVDGEINKRFIPHIQPDRTTFELRFVFDWSSSTNREK